MEGEINIDIDYEKFKNDSTWDGLKGYITNTTLTGTEVINNYNNLWKIEKAFRISKTDLKIRPIYHRLHDRIEAHICISFVSYLLHKELETALKRSNSGISINKAIKAINKMYEIVIDKHKRILLKNNETQQKIIELVNSKF